MTGDAMLSMISRKHPNRKAHNWLAYEIGDRFLRKHCSLLKGVVYDLGAGEAPYRDFFLLYADQYIAVDWASSLHETQADVLADLNESLAIKDGAADTLICLSVLEHLREPGFMLREAHRITKPGGSLLLQVPWQWWIHEPPYDFFRFTPYGLKYLLERAGFVEIEVEPQAGFFTTVILKFNYFSLRLIRGPLFARLLLFSVFSIAWHLGQIVAPWLDRLDRNWALEAPGYFVTAKRSCT
jgi:SAM-dependent methyltransferase